MQTIVQEYLSCVQQMSIMGEEWGGGGSGEGEKEGKERGGAVSKVSDHQAGGRFRDEWE